MQWSLQHQLSAGALCRPPRSPALGLRRHRRMAKGDKLGIHLPVWPAELASAVASPLAVSSCFQLGNCWCLLELRYRTKHLPDQNSGRRVLKEKVGDGRRDEVDPPFSMSWPASCTAKSRAKRSGLSTIMVRIPLLAIRWSTDRKPGRSVIASAPDTAASIELGLDHVAICLGKPLDREEKAA